MQRTPADGDTPDLLASPDNLDDIQRARDAVRELRRRAKALDRDQDALARTYDADLVRCLLIICGRIIGGQRRELTELDRVCLEQVLGLVIDPVEFTKLSGDLPSRPPAELDAIFPGLLRQKASEDARIHDVCDSLIRSFEAVARSTGRVYGDPHEKRVVMAKRIALQLRQMVEKERDRLADSPAAESPGGGDQSVAGNELTRTGDPGRS